MPPTCQTNFVTSRVRVALIIEGGKIKPVWFEEKDRSARDRIFIKAVNSTWSHQEGSAKVIDFSVTGGDGNCYQLSLNPIEFTWQLWISETN
jgi:hypothetical protein